MEVEVAILSDTEIKNKITNNELVIGGDFSNVGPACYELRMGHIYYDLTEDDKRIDATDQGYALIKPGHRVVLIIKELLKIPNNIIARVTSKGSLFSIGLSPVSTYADPGFAGNLGIVTQNFSDKYITIPIGEHIAKVDFSLLTSDSKNPYQGQHGYQTQIWPVKHQLQKTYSEIKGDPRVRSEEEEAFEILPRATACAIKALQRKQRKIGISILIFLIISTLTLAALSTEKIEPISAVATNLISSAIIGMVIWFTGPRE
jgi:dCTP deaminase